MKHFASRPLQPCLRTLWPIASFLVFCLAHSPAQAAGKAHSSDLAIVRDPATGKLNVSWSSGGGLKQSRTVDGAFKPVHTRGKSHLVAPEEDQMVFRLESAGAGTVYSVNVVGYINAQVPPGLSLLANQLWNQDNTVELLIHTPPDGAQVYKFVEGIGYEVSTFDGASGTWSNPDMDLTPGIGFFFKNPTSATITITFVGYVLQGTLINRLPAGFSTEGALVPQTATLSQHLVPGEPGDIVRLYVNDGLGGEEYISSVFSAEGAWVPDLILPVGAGFVSERQNAVDWVRVFHVN